MPYSKHQRFDPELFPSFQAPFYFKTAVKLAVSPKRIYITQIISSSIFHDFQPSTVINCFMIFSICDFTADFLRFIYLLHRKRHKPQHLCNMNDGKRNKKKTSLNIRNID